MLPIAIRIKFNLFFVFCFSLIIGFFSEFGSFLSLSRTICFFGYFLLGYYCKEDVFKKIKKCKIIILCIAVIISILLFMFFTSEYGLSHVKGIIHTLHRSIPYKEMEIGRINGLVFRIITVPLSILFSSLVLAFIPNTKTIFSRLGKESIIIFVFHGYFIRLIQKLINIHGNELIDGILLILLSIGITFFLSIPLFYQVYNECMKKIENIFMKK
jgi:fucose 4-O-acetylase-like acetyltransferase